MVETSPIKLPEYKPSSPEPLRSSHRRSSQLEPINFYSKVNATVSFRSEEVDINTRKDPF